VVNASGGEVSNNYLTGEVSAFGFLVQSYKNLTFSNNLVCI
jgi:hypothetical protein